jgi:dTDP-glucose 4,6-dehydratase
MRFTVSLGAVGLFSEDTPYAPNSPYAASKASADHLVRAYRETYGLPALITNCSNNYGPYQFPEKADSADGAQCHRRLNRFRFTATAEKTCGTGYTWRITVRELPSFSSADGPGEKYNIGGGNEPYQPGDH